MSEERASLQFDRKTVITVLVALAVAFGMFYAGTRYEKSKLKSASHSQSKQTGVKKSKSSKKENVAVPAGEQGATAAPSGTPAPAPAVTPQDTATTDTTMGSDSGK